MAPTEGRVAKPVLISITHCAQANQWSLPIVPSFMSFKYWRYYQKQKVWCRLHLLCLW